MCITTLIIIYMETWNAWHRLLVYNNWRDKWHSHSLPQIVFDTLMFTCTATNLTNPNPQHYKIRISAELLFPVKMANHISRTKGHCSAVSKTYVDMIFHETALTSIRQCAIYWIQEYEQQEQAWRTWNLDGWKLETPEDTPVKSSLRVLPWEKKRYEFKVNRWMHQTLARRSILGCCMIAEHNQLSKTKLFCRHHIEGLFLGSTM